MIKISESIKKYKIIILLLFLVIVIIVLKLLAKTNKKTETQISTISPTLVPYPITTIVSQSNFQNIIPGVTTQKDLEQKLGKPTNVSQVGNEIVYQYPSSVKNWPTEISISKANQTVSLIKNYFPKDTFQDVIKKYGNPEMEPLYGPDSVNGFLTYVWLKQGLAVVANNQSGIILETWYFSSMTNDEFLKEAGKNLSKTPLEFF